MTNAGCPASAPAPAETPGGLAPGPSANEPQARSGGPEAPAAGTPIPPTEGGTAPREGALSNPDPPPLTAEELALIEKDPRELSVEDRRRRAYALRKKILQHPDSPAAKELERWRQMYEDGQVDLSTAKAKGATTTRLHARTRPQGARRGGS